MAGGDSLSVLPDDVLRRVLHFAPAREGASTSALSKQWRGLWQSSGAVNLDARFPEDVDYVELYSRRDAFVSAARLALEAAGAGGSPVTRLTFSVDTGGRDRVKELLYHDVGRWSTRSPDVVTELLSLPAARHVEELWLDAGYSRDLSDFVEHTTSSYTGFGELSFLCLLSDTLRVLDVTGCEDLHPSPRPSVAFPRLASLRLSHGNVKIEHLQDVIDAAPALATVYLESVNVDDGGDTQPEVVHLHCPRVTELLMDSCGWPNEWGFRGGTTTVEIDGPRLRRFTYKGLLRPLSLTSQAPDLERVHLHIFPDSRDKDAARDIATFWRCAHNFSNAKELKLRVNMLEDIAVVGSANRAKLLCSFPNLHLLQLEGTHRLQGKTAAVAVANLLRCCPVLRDIRINLTMAQPDPNRRAQQGQRFLEKKYRRDLEKSIHGFMNRRLLEPAVSVEGDCDDGDDTYDNLPDLPALSGQDFECLQSSLCCVRLQFRPETNIFGQKSRSIFGVHLIKFFAENAAVLKEMHIHGGNGKMCEHINRKLERWVTTNSSEKRKTTFLVLPLEVR